MPQIPASLRRRVVERAAARCEYCGLAQVGQEATFHVDHIIPQASHGTTDLPNLALSCVSCSPRKSAREYAIDPQSGGVVPLFHPRKDNWQVHFQWTGVILQGITPVGRATVEALQLNRPLILAIRSEEAALERHPPI